MWIFTHSVIHVQHLIYDFIQLQLFLIFYLEMSFSFSWSIIFLTISLAKIFDSVFIWKYRVLELFNHHSKRVFGKWNLAFPCRWFDFTLLSVSEKREKYYCILLLDHLDGCTWQLLEILSCIAPSALAGLHAFEPVWLVENNIHVIPLFMVCL